MHRVRQYPSQVEAMAAVSYLREHGVVARVMHSQTISLMASAIGSWDVQISQRDQRESAESLLDVFDAEPVSDVQEPDPLPDLSRADASLAPVCPACGVTLPMDPACDRCIGCRAPVNVVELIVAAHGPEALVDCYPDTTMQVDTADVEMWCVACEYALVGLETVGRCPECGQPYDKDQMFRSMLGDR